MIHIAKTKTWPVDDLYSFLQGNWSLYRTLNDLPMNMPGVLRGKVEITPGDGDDLIYRERGELVLGDHREDIDRTFHYKFPDRKGAPHLAQVHFAGGGIFHPLDLSTGLHKVVYEGEEDTYRGTFSVENGDIWNVNWFVTGPSKEIIIDSRLQRSS